MKTLYRILMLFCSLVMLTVGKAYPQNKELIRYDETAFEKVTRDVNHEDFNSKEKYALQVFREYVGQKGIAVGFSEKDYLEAKKENHQLREQLSSVEKIKKELELRLFTIRYKEAEIDSLHFQLSELQCQNKALLMQLDEKSAVIAQLQLELQTVNTGNRSQTNDLQKYQRAVDEAKNTICGIYNSNLVKLIIEMDPNQLDEANSKFDGMKALLEIDQDMFKDLQGKIDEINAWNALINPMKAAKQFMKGKYDDKAQKEYVAAISGVTIKGSKTAEKNMALLLLTDEAKLHENYDNIIRNIEEYGCLPSTETLWSANEMLARMTSNMPFYHPAVYDSYDRGINMLRVELSKSAPSNKVKTAAEFNKFINELKEIF